jgi:hypothetical protein
MAHGLLPSGRIVSGDALVLQQLTGLGHLRMANLGHWLVLVAPVLIPRIP